MKRWIKKLKSLFADKEQKPKNDIIALSPNDTLFKDDSLSDFSEYEVFLESAFHNDNVHNIAVTGNFGIGKSSIIRSYETKHAKRGRQYLYISLMDFNNDKDMRRGKETEEGDNTKLQQDFERYLLCQILSRVDTQKLPFSKYRLISSKRPKKRFWFAFLISLIAVCVFGIINRAALTVSDSFLQKMYYLCWLACGTLTFTVVAGLMGSFKVTKFTAGYGQTEIEAENRETTGSYIDDHIFEIVNALEVLSKDIDYTVVLEDMDRLGRKICVDIFSKLRRLNYLINDRKELKGKSIRFIYAFDDSIFELTKNTKFFDYVMSVTPKLNDSSAGKYFRDLILKSLPEENEDKAGLYNIVTQYEDEFWDSVGLVIHDYRMLNHIANDFQLFVKIMRKRGLHPDNKWLPFVIYKNVLAEDYCNVFEKKGILELEKSERNQRIDAICAVKGEKYCKTVKDLFDYLIEKIKLNITDLQKFTGFSQKAKRARDDGADSSRVLEMLKSAPDHKRELLTPFLAGKTVLVTGGGGTVGSELCRQMAEYDIKALVIVDLAETNAYEIYQELLVKKQRNCPVFVEIASIRDKSKMDSLFEKYRPEIVIHAAAHKFVPLMERNPEEAIKNNIIGTYNVMTAAERYDVEKFIFVSTDKANNPSNVMGITKRFCEMMVCGRNSKDAVFCAVRLGNLLGSAGSVIPLFRKQIASGGPVTITDHNIVRYFMTIPEGGQLILQSGAIARHSGVYILDMGKPVKIYDLALNLIRLSGLEPYKDIDIVETGLRPGDKLYQELYSVEGLSKTELENVFVDDFADTIGNEKTEEIISRLTEKINENASGNELLRIVMEVVPVAPQYLDERSEVQLS